jgi:hypothetical protein
MMKTGWQRWLSGVAPKALKSIGEDWPLVAGHSVIEFTWKEDCRCSKGLKNQIAIDFIERRCGWRSYSAELAFIEGIVRWLDKLFPSVCQLRVSRHVAFASSLLPR